MLEFVGAATVLIVLIPVEDDVSFVLVPVEDDVKSVVVVAKSLYIDSPLKSLLMHSIFRTEPAESAASLEKIVWVRQTGKSVPLINWFLSSPGCRTISLKKIKIYQVKSPLYPPPTTREISKQELPMKHFVAVSVGQHSAYVPDIMKAESVLQLCADAIGVVRYTYC